MRTIWSCSLAIAVCGLMLAAPATAVVHNFTISLDGLQETPSVPTPGTGFGTATLDDVTLQFTMNGTFQDLVGTTTNAHVHGPSALGGPAAGVLFGHFYTPGVTSGVFNFNGVISASHAQTILDGLAYVNIHTTFRSGGEIRGQILPEPATAGLVLLGLLGATGLRRRRPLA